MGKLLELKKEKIVRQGDGVTMSETKSSADAIRTLVTPIWKRALICYISGLHQQWHHISKTFKKIM